MRGKGKLENGKEKVMKRQKEQRRDGEQKRNKGGEEVLHRVAFLLGFCTFLLYFCKTQSDNVFFMNFSV